MLLYIVKCYLPVYTKKLGKTKFKNYNLQNENRQNYPNVTYLICKLIHVDTINTLHCSYAF